MAYKIIHTVDIHNIKEENAKLAAARALYAELLKYYNAKTSAERSA